MKLILLRFSCNATVCPLFLFVHFSLKEIRNNRTNRKLAKMQQFIFRTIFFFFSSSFSCWFCYRYIGVIQLCNCKPQAKSEMHFHSFSNRNFFLFFLSFFVWKTFCILLFRLTFSSWLFVFLTCILYTVSLLTFFHRISWLLSGKIKTRL